MTRRLLTLYLAGVAVLLGLILGMTGGHFSCSLDDPYIHLALAQQIIHGHYGLNAGEPSAPSSSIVWPFLLAPLSRTPFATWLPLAYNIGFGVLTCLVLGRILERWWLARVPEPSAGAQWGIALLLIVVGNLLGLTFVGMEHLLQLALVCGCVYGLLAAYEGQPMPRWTLACAALAPAVRYEDFAFTLPVVLVCWWQGRRAAALWTGLGALLPVAAFSLFLHHIGLFWLPTSVLVKGGVTGEYSQHPVTGHLQMVIGNYLRPGGLVIVLMEIGLLILAWRVREDAGRRRVLGAAALGAALMIVAGPYGWMYRYEVCVRLFLALLLFTLLAGRRKVALRWLAAGLLVVGAVYVKALLVTPIASRDIYRQQFQMHRFVHDFYRGNYAINDLGWVSVDYPDSSYVLDLVGLASQEAASRKDKTPAWMDSVVRRHHVGLVMIYTGWFKAIPADWTEVAVLHMPLRRHARTLWSDTVEFYATPEADLPALRAELHAGTMPSHTWVSFPDEAGRPGAAR